MSWTPLLVCIAEALSVATPRQVFQPGATADTGSSAAGAAISTPMSQGHIGRRADSDKDPAGIYLILGNDKKIRIGEGENFSSTFNPSLKQFFVAIFSKGHSPRMLFVSASEAGALSIEDVSPALSKAQNDAEKGPRFIDPSQFRNSGLVALRRAGAPATGQRAQPASRTVDIARSERGGRIATVD